MTPVTVRCRVPARAAAIMMPRGQATWWNALQLMLVACRQSCRWMPRSSGWMVIICQGLRVICLLEERIYRPYFSMTQI